MTTFDLEELKDISILCVEDEDGIRDSIVNTLGYYFNNVYEASNGNEGYEMYEYYKPKIVLSDIQMKDCDGIEFVKKIRQKDENTIIIMLTAYSNEEYLLELINLNINHFILKPLNTKKLDEIFKKILSKNDECIVLFENLILDLKKRELVYKNNEVIPLRKREKDFLKLLYDNKDGILSYEKIECEIWIDKEMTSYALKSLVKEIRNKLPINIIKNVPQEGYTLVKN
ncbi:DNA-binding response regulator [Malaciobacter pacificus]|jgi:DNA-binding response OmpR family regulator|uniref:Two-component system response regulator n=1 Tax=Malaciobacter pacificus TaxID=1080223 RepID=A0A5C2HCJ9_9BACT|nr:response regulator [Malaciobacter pacificus]QEP34032.1 two-component system response regulator [Malaciobacter pacificus]GGD35991.1 DNA-binding response regulator [Malaciobacter pacificus]